MQQAAATYAIWLGRQPYQPIWELMRRYTAERTSDAPDWLLALEHPELYTLGQAGKEAHLKPEARALGVPVVRSDRGGEVTWHGPGQLVLYLLWDLGRRNLTVRSLVRRVEEAISALLAEHGIAASRQPGAPGVYVAGAKIASLGFRITRGCCYHGLSLNISNDLAPFEAIHPCGYPGLRVTRTADWGWSPTLQQAAEALVRYLAPEARWREQEELPAEFHSA